MSAILLHGYWRSSASYRVRIALNLKGLAYTQVTHDLRTGVQRSAEYLALAPHGLLPAVEYEGKVLIESPAILEWLEARWPERPLLPASAEDAAMVRAMSALIACDIHPLNNLRVFAALRDDFGATEQQVAAWVGRWITDGFAALERLVERHGGRFAFGDTPTLVDCYLVPQIYNAERFAIDLTSFPHLAATNTLAKSLPEIAAAHPSLQPDADR